MTLYNYPPDPVNESVCYDQCATAWPPLIVESADKITAAEGIPGVFGTATRKDGALQVTYNGQPLYYWARDKQAGDTTGHRVGRIWWVVAPATVDIQYNQKLGPILVGPKGMTLYMFTKDTENVSNCYDQCATNWPPLLVNSADEFVPGSIVAGKFDFIARKDGGTQVTYNGMPLYYWKDDKAIGDTTGENVGEVWFTVPAQVIASKNTADLGDFLVSNDGMTLYLFTKDAEGVSNCSGDCAKAWPPYTVSELHKLVTPPGMMGKLDKIKRDDGNFQVTYNGMPLYFYTKDTAPGDTTGQKVGDVWFVVKP
jgi:predicted lipoprotein with Yx(FWY)xxD motif